MNLDLPALMCLAMAALPCGLFLANLRIYRPLAKDRFESAGGVSVLIPARNEALNIRATLAAALANQGIELEVIVLDDHSTDATAAIVSETASRDSRVRWVNAPPLPAGWCGKQHACFLLAQLARHPWLVFLDADVRLAPDALARMVGFMSRRDAALASGVPRQECGTISERLLIPLIHFILLGFLPMRVMRRNRSPAYSAGCGQLFIARRDAYHRCGGHAQLRDSLHDGIKLPRVFRRAGFHTDLFDATDVASCRMYRTNAETWRGLGKNATEGLAAPAAILPMTTLLMLGQVVPFVLCFLAAPGSRSFCLAALAGGLALLPRAVAARRFRQSWRGALLHPLGVLCLLAIQWHALLRKWLGRPMQWKGRDYLPSKFHPEVPAVRVLPAVLAALWLWAVPPRAQPAPPPAVPDLVCPGFELQDQFTTNHVVDFPRPKPMVLIVADRKGSEQIEGWAAAFRKKFGLRLELTGVADVGGAPAWVHGTIRKSFRKQYAYPVLLDWSGRLPARLHCQKDAANVFLLDPSGRVLAMAAGPCSDAAWQRLARAAEPVVEAP